MKKILKVLSCFIVLISASLIFFACDKKEKIILQTPVYVGIVENGELSEETIPNGKKRTFLNSQLLLVTEKNQYASGYRFYITDSDNYQLESNYVSFETEGNNKNYLDVTDVFKDKKVYHFYVQYLGSGNYLNSKCSTIKKEYTPTKEQIEAPYIQLVDKKVCWTQIVNAEGYEIYEQIIDKDDQIVQNLKKIGSTNSDVFEYNIADRMNQENSPYYKYQYEVKAISKNFYLNSKLSNTVEYIKEIKLGNVDGLVINKENNNYILTWNTVKYVNKYEIIINNVHTIEVENNSLNITSYLSNYGDYSITVKSKKSEAICYQEGDKSSEYLFKYTTKLVSPNISNIITDGEYIEIAITEVSLASNGYTIEIIYNGISTIKKLEDQIVLRLDITNIVGELTSDKEITIKVKANAVGEYILESDYYSEQFTVLKLESE